MKRLAAIVVLVAPALMWPWFGPFLPELDAVLGQGDPLGGGLLAVLVVGRMLWVVLGPGLAAALLVDMVLVGRTKRLGAQ